MVLKTSLTSCKISAKSVELYCKTLQSCHSINDLYGGTIVDIIDWVYHLATPTLNFGNGGANLKGLKTFKEHHYS